MSRPIRIANYLGTGRHPGTITLEELAAKLSTSPGDVLETIHEERQNGTPICTDTDLDGYIQVYLPKTTSHLFQTVCFLEDAAKKMTEDAELFRKIINDRRKQGIEIEEDKKELERWNVK